MGGYLKKRNTKNKNQKIDTKNQENVNKKNNKGKKEEVKQVEEESTFQIEEMEAILTELLRSYYERMAAQDKKSSN
jgi:hypothetical protein